MKNTGSESQAKYSDILEAVSCYCCFQLHTEHTELATYLHLARGIIGPSEACTFQKEKKSTNNQVGKNAMTSLVRVIL